MRVEYARGLVAAWHHDATMYHALASVALDLGESMVGLRPEDINEALNAAVGFTFYTQTVMPFLATYFRPVSDMLFDGKSDDAAVELLVKLKPVRRSMPRSDRRERQRNSRRVQCRPIVAARELDKNHDWSTVK